MKKIFLVRVKDRKSSTLIQEIKKHIKTGSIIYSDMWKGYCKLEQFGFSHLTVDHSKHFKDPKTGACTNTIEGIWSGINKLYLIILKMKKILIQNYLSLYGEEKIKTMNGMHLSML